MADDVTPTHDILSVSQVSAALKRCVEQNFGRVRLRGEVSGYRGPHGSGHVYFSLKDEAAKIDAVIWKGSFARLRVKPEEGLEVVVEGKLTTFPGSSKYQIVVEKLEPSGAGALMKLLEERRKKLTAEGLFAPERKKPLPVLPRVIGVITSPTGAVIRDILHRVQERCPGHILLWPVRVQGDTSAAEIAAAIKGFNAFNGTASLPRPDLLIVARGGGSLEDLWSFNEEIVVRAAAASAIPLIAAVGHETDWTLIDLAADQRAPTPTAAAEMAVPVRAEKRTQLDGLGARLSQNLLKKLALQRQMVQGQARGLPALDQLFSLPRQRLDRAGERLAGGLISRVQGARLRFTRLQAGLSLPVLHQRLLRARDGLQQLAQQRERVFFHTHNRRTETLNRLGQMLNALSYRRVLERGYAVVRGADGALLTRRAQLSAGASATLVFADGEVKVVRE